MKGRRDSDGFCHGDGGYDAVIVGSGYGGSVAACRMSMAGIKVCLIEKGRRWEASDFPTNSSQIMSEVRVESKGGSFGRKDALFQVNFQSPINRADLDLTQRIKLHDQGDSFAGAICGLGGGSLANAGLMVPTPARVKRDPRWPKEWQVDWEACEAHAVAMVNPQDNPVEFATATAMREAYEEIEESSPRPSLVKQSVNFTHEKEPDSKGLEPCVACGNCLSGCPYNAKKSNDKNYIALAIQAIITECEVWYIVKAANEDYYSENGDINGKQRGRRWHIYFDNLEYISANFVILSAGVLGATQILFQSERRGLKVSERLGFGFSSNGNNVAYLDGSSVPINGQGLKKAEFSKIPLQDRPGPTISSSYISSVGFTIQSAIIPTAYPHLLLKGIATYGWPNNYWFLHDVIDKLKYTIGVKSSKGMILNSMGYDSGNGRITLDKSTEKINFTAADDPLLPRKVKALQRITNRLGGNLFMSTYRSMSVHLSGGCNAATDPSQGVCNPNGQVFKPQNDPQAVHQGLYVCDASLIPCPIGTSPCLSILAVAEHVSKHLVEDIIEYNKSFNHPNSVPSGQVEAQAFMDKKGLQVVSSELHPGINGGSIKRRMGSSNEVLVKEKMTGQLGGMPCTVYLIMKMNSGNQRSHNKGNVTGGESHPILRGKVGGYVLSEFVQKDKLYIIDGSVDMCSLDCRTPYTQYMRYRLLLASASSSRYLLEGSKIMNPYLVASYAWAETRTLHVTFKEIRPKDDSLEEPLNLTGQLRVSIVELMRSLVTLKGHQRGKFVYHLLQSFFRTYILQSPRLSHLDFSSFNLTQKPYPPSTLHEIKTDDGFIITCKQWLPNGEKKPYPVLLIGGYVHEVFCLPTEPRDMVRTLLDEGYETWVLQSRLHPFHPANYFTLDDIGKFDIPSAIAKIRELHGPSSKVHVVGHCSGGLCIHISLMGGHTSASNIASLSCTNSSMYFKLTNLARVKLRLPLLPITMAVLGKSKILPLFENLNESPIQWLVKSILRLIPRYERCTCKECEVVSGVFGNAFWHENVSPTLHHWVNKQSQPQLPVSGLLQIGKIGNKGHIVDAYGNDIYLIHPERMSLPTLYITGGRTLLTTPETSLFAHQYMKLHQPGFHHRRVVVEGFGHSDVFLGEEAYKKIFPRILSHMKFVEQQRNGATTMNMEERSYRKEASSWGNSNEENGGSGSLISILILAVSIIVMVFFFTRTTGI